MLNGIETLLTVLVHIPGIGSFSVVQGWCGLILGFKQGLGLSGTSLLVADSLVLLFRRSGGNATLGSFPLGSTQDSSNEQNQITCLDFGSLSFSMVFLK